MTFQNLEYFLAVAKEQNITRAAEQLNISQQALSNQISRLEQEIGAELFNRKHGFELTYAGKILQESASRILDINKQTENIINDITSNNRGELKIGVSHTRGQAILPLLIPEFSKQYPQVSLTVVEDNTRLLEERLEKGSVDVMIGFKPFLLESAKSIDLMKEKLFIVASNSLLKSHFGNDYTKICEQYRENPDLSIFNDMPFVLLKKGDRIRTITDAEFLKAGIHPEISLETGNIQTSFALAAEGIGFAVIPDLYLHSPYLISGNQESGLRHYVTLLPFTSPGNTIAIGYNTDRYLSSFAQAFIDLALKKFERFI
ncbi:MAG: LysR family transcriptional regulator [Lachnospiraceae bacterium]|nr:LysR family transcriptional regulator [Lachnospiraceae bacterium]